MLSKNPVQNTPDAERARLKQARAQITDAQKDRGGLLMRARLFTWLSLRWEAAAQAGQTPPSVVAAYYPLKGEPDLLGLLQQWADGAVKVVMPVITQRDAPLQFRRWMPDTPMARGLAGAMEPQEGEFLTPDIVLVPTLGYTGQADRLGYGGGYYDRTLAALAAAGVSPMCIGVAWNEGQLSPSYQAQSHDVRLDAILTPAGWIPAAP